MIQNILTRHNFLAGIAIFSMFFGAGNVVFPLTLGISTGSHFPIALMGLIITSIGFPLIGLIGSSLFEGKSLPFFLKGGRAIGLTMMLTCMALLGPCAVMPRCVTVAYAALESMMPGIGLNLFTALFGGLALAITLMKNSIMKIVGTVLSPLLLISLLMIIAKGMGSHLEFAPASISQVAAFQEGMLTGYDTLDLIASLFFSVTIWKMLSKNGPHVVKSALFSSLVGGTCLALIYAGLCWVTAGHATDLQGVAPDRLLSTLAFMQLGPFYGAIANIAIALACMTTIISISITITHVIQDDFKVAKPSGKWINTAILVITTLCANWGFEHLMEIIHFMATLLYPSIIILTLCNIANKLYGWRFIKSPVAATLSLTVLSKVL